jgi:hypothetical protein
MAPRTRLSAALARKEARYTGVYLLHGALDGEARAYIGEGEDISDRIRSHWKSTAGRYLVAAARSRDNQAAGPRLCPASERIDAENAELRSSVV